MYKREKEVESTEVKEIPIVNIRMMTDEEWNRLAYMNYLQRKEVSV